MRSFSEQQTANRLILELMARGGMRIGEVLKLTLDDIEDRKLLLREPKSGKEHEVVFIPQKLANRLHSYAIKDLRQPYRSEFSQFPMKRPG
jgi:integrase/recombinase XerD